MKSFRTEIRDIFPIPLKEKVQKGTMSRRPHDTRKGAVIMEARQTVVLSLNALARGKVPDINEPVIHNNYVLNSIQSAVCCLVNVHATGRSAGS